MEAKQLRALYNELTAHRDNLRNTRNAMAETEAKLNNLLRSLDATTTRLEVKEGMQ